jgi:ATP-dependent Zn protease
METKETLQKKLHEKELEIEKRDTIISRQSNGSHIISNLKNHEYTKNYNEKSNRKLATIIFTIIVVLLFIVFTKK